MQSWGGTSIIILGLRSDHENSYIHLNQLFMLVLCGECWRTNCRWIAGNYLISNQEICMSGSFLANCYSLNAHEVYKLTMWENKFSGPSTVCWESHDAPKVTCYTIQNSSRDFGFSPMWASSPLRPSQTSSFQYQRIYRHFISMRISVCTKN